MVAFPLQISSIGAWVFFILLFVMVYYLLKEADKK